MAQDGDYNIEDEDENNLTYPNGDEWDDQDGEHVSYIGDCKEIKITDVDAPPYYSK